MKETATTLLSFTSWHAVNKKLISTVVMMCVLASLLIKNVMPMPMNTQIECGIVNGQLEAQFGKAFNFQDKHSIVFDVYDINKKPLFTEIVPIESKRPLLGVFASPLNIKRQMKYAISTSCSASPTLGTKRQCAYSTHVDNGISINVSEMELFQHRLYIRGVASHKMLGAQVIGRFRSDTLVLRSSNGRARSLVVLSGLDPQSFIFKTRLIRETSQDFSIGFPNVEEPLVWLCIK